MGNDIKDFDQKWKTFQDKLGTDGSTRNSWQVI